MDRIIYENFDLEFSKAGNACSVKARSFAGETKSQFALPFTIEQAEDFILQIERSIVGEALQIDLVKKFGGNLFEAVWQANIQAIYKSSLDQTMKEGKGLRIRLHLQDIPEFAHLPWEFLYSLSTNQFLCLNRQTPIVRYVDMPKMISPLRVKPPLRILVVVSLPTGLNHLNVDEEKAKVQKALADLDKWGLVEIHWLELATVSELQRTLRRVNYHIFHFIGHGDFDTASNQGWLAFEDDDESMRRVDAEQLAAILTNHRTLRLVVLNSCKGARNSLTSPFSGTATTLVQQGIPAVVAMQFTITDAAAIKFASEFYAATADGLPVDSAVTEARVAFFSGENQIEWGTPLLFMRSPDGLLFDLKKSKRQPLQEKPSQKNKTTIGAIFYILTTLLFVAVTLVILKRIGTNIEIDVVAQKVGFLLPPEISAGEEVPLLYSGLWTSLISIEDFQPIELTIDSLFALNKSWAFNNSLRISPDPSENGRVTFYSPLSELSLQEVISDSGSTISLQRDGESLYFEIENGSQNPSQRLSFGEYVQLSVEECTVIDGAGHNLNNIFGNSVRLKLHKVSRSLIIRGDNRQIHTTIARDQSGSSDRVQFILEQPIQDLDFTTDAYLPAKIIKRSTIDSIFVKRNFPLDSLSFKSHDLGDLELAPEPNQFILYNLSEFGNALMVRAQGRFTSIKIGQGVMRRELVPTYFSLIAKHPTTSLVITWLGWILTVLVPLIMNVMAKRKNREG